MLKGAIFDFDGTIVDSMFIWDNIGVDYLRSLGKEPRENLKKTFAAFTLEKAAQYYRNHYDVVLSVREIVDGVNKMIEEYYRTEVTLKKGVSDYLFWLRENDVKMCIATVTDRHLAEKTLYRLGISSCFSEIFTCDEVGQGKDEPAIYRKALEFLGTNKEETCIFEDSLFAVKTAKEDNFTVAAVFDEYEKEQDKLMYLADYYIRDYYDPVLKTI